MRFKSSILMIFLIVAALATGACFSGVSRTAGNTKPLIVATTYPLYDFTRNIAGDKAEVVLLIPPGAEAHSWEPGPGDVVKVNKASLVIYNGAGMEPWIDKDSSLLNGKKTVDASKLVTLLSSKDAIHEHDHESGPEDEDKHPHNDHAKDAKGSEHTHSHEHGAFDPHIWLDPVNAQAIVSAIAQALAETDSANAKVYAGNASAYGDQLKALDQEFKTALSAAAGKEIVTTHAAFGYLAKRYGLKQSAIMGIDPEAEPTPETMGKIVRHIKEEKVTTIFSEPVLNPKLAEAVARETGARILPLNPIHEVTEADTKLGYIAIMRNNLATLKKALL